MIFLDWIGILTASLFGTAAVLSLLNNGATTETIALGAAAQATITAVKVSRMERRQKGEL